MLGILTASHLVCEIDTFFPANASKPIPIALRQPEPEFWKDYDGRSPYKRTDEMYTLQRHYHCWGFRTLYLYQTCHKVEPINHPSQAHPLITKSLVRKIYSQHTHPFSRANPHNLRPHRDPTGTLWNTGHPHQTRTPQATQAHPHTPYGTTTFMHI